MGKELTTEKKLRITIEALKQCANLSGEYDNKFIQPKNCIENVSRLAKIALTKIGVDFTNVKIDQS
jgi:hypothetical protein